jgi:hypothetical protein
MVISAASYLHCKSFTSACGGLERRRYMLYVVLGYLLVSGLFALLFWLMLVVAKRSDERNTLDSSEEESKEK